MTAGPKPEGYGSIPKNLKTRNRIPQLLAETTVKMARFALLAVCAARGAVALVPPAAPAARSQLRMAGDAELVPVNEDSIKTSSAVTAGGAGFLVGGPVFGAITAAAGNYAAKQDSEVCSGVRTRSRV